MLFYRITLFMIINLSIRAFRRFPVRNSCAVVSKSNYGHKAMAADDNQDSDRSLLNSTQGYHTPVLLDECCTYLNIQKGSLYIDCTLGGGGHTAAILDRGGLVIGLDQDRDAIAFASNRLRTFIEDGKLEIIKVNFRELSSLKERSNLLKSHEVRGILMDLGVSSHQINEASRGFAFGVDGPLDMRMAQDGESALKASKMLNELSGTVLADILYEYGEETKSRQIARDIVLARPLNTTQDLVKIIARHGSFKQRPKMLARCFQALRIYVNDELGALEDALASARNLLALDARLAIISYHSLEDRIVKNFFREDEIGKVSKDTSWNILTRKVITPGEDELARNRRSRSAKLRVAEKKLSESQEVKKPSSFLGKKQLAKLQASSNVNLTSNEIQN